MNRCRLAALILTTGLVVFALPKIAAAAPYSLTTSPVSVNLSTKPGSSSTTALQVENNGSTALQIAVSLEQFSANGKTGEAKITPIPSGDPIASYVSFSRQTFSAPPGQWVTIQMKVNLPPSAQLGYYYAVIFKPLLASFKATNGNVIKGSNAILVLVDTHSSNEQRNLSLAGFSSSHFYEYLPVNFTVSVRNKGNIFLAPSGDIFISRSLNFSDPLADLRINPGQGNVLPDSVRIFSASWSDGFPVYVPKMVGPQPVLNKNGQPVLQLKWDFSRLSKLRFGKYYAHLALVYNDGLRDVPIDATISFWVVPWKLLIALIAFLAIVALGLFSFGKDMTRYIKKQRAKRHAKDTPKL